MAAATDPTYVASKIVVGDDMEAVAAIVDEATQPKAGEGGESAPGKWKAKRGDGGRRRGRGHKQPEADSADRYEGKAGKFDALDGAKSIEGWVVFVSNVKDTANEDDLYDAFAACGAVQQLTLNLDRRTGFVKGYALIQYDDKEGAQAAINTLNGTEFLGQVIDVDWAFKRPPRK